MSPPFRVRPTLALLAAVIFGILAAPYLPLPPLAFFAAFVVAVIAGAILIFRSRPFALAFWLLAFFLFSVGRARLIMVPGPDDVSRLAGSPSVWVLGSVVSDVEGRERGGSAFTLAVSAVNDFRSVRQVSGQVRVRLGGARPETGDVLWLRGRIEEPPTATNPNGFDYRRYLATKGVFSAMYVRPDDLRLVRRDRPWPDCLWESPPAAIRGLIREIRGKIREGNRKLTPRYAGLMNGLVLSDRGGDRYDPAAPLQSGMNVETEEAFLRTGAVHLLSVSGSHMGALSILLIFLFSAVFAPRSVSALVIIALLWLFALASGASAAASRAALMSSVFLLAPLVRRSANLTDSLIFAALALLVCIPGDLYDIGFQFSFAALGAFCLYGAPLIRLTLRRRPEDAPVFRWTRPFLICVVAGVVFALGSEPLSAYYFNRLSPVSPFANAVVVPVASVLTIIGLFSPLLTLLPAPVVSAVAIVTEGGVRALLFLIHSFASLPFASLSVVSPPGWTVILYYAVLGILSPYFRLYALRKAIFNPFPSAPMDSGAPAVPVAAGRMPNP